MGSAGCRQGRRSLLHTAPACGTRHLPQITSEVFVPFSFITSPFSSQLQARTRHHLSRSLGMQSPRGGARKAAGGQPAGLGGCWLGAHPALGPNLWDGDARLLAPSCSMVLDRTRRSVDLRPALTEKPWGLGTSAVAEQLRDGLMTGYKWLHGEVISGRRYKQSEIQWLATEARLIQSGSKAHVSTRECK